MSRLWCLCWVVTVKRFPVIAFNIVIITTIVRIYTWQPFIASSAVCDCGTSWSYSLTILDVTTLVFVLSGYCKKFPCTCIQYPSFTIARIYTWQSFIALSTVCDCGISWSYSLTVFQMFFFCTSNTSINRSAASLASHHNWRHLIKKTVHIIML